MLHYQFPRWLLLIFITLFKKVYWLSTLNKKMSLFIVLIKEAPNSFSFENPPKKLKFLKVNPLKVFSSIFKMQMINLYGHVCIDNFVLHTFAIDIETGTK